MSLPNLANKVNELCGKIQKLNKQSTFIRLNLIDQTIEDAGILIQDFPVELPSTIVSVPINTALLFDNYTAKNMRLTDSKNIIVNLSGQYLFNFNTTVKGATAFENDTSIIITVNNIVASFFLPNLPISGGSNQSTTTLELQKGDIVNFYVFKEGSPPTIDVDIIEFSILISKL